MIKKCLLLLIFTCIFSNSNTMDIEIDLLEDLAEHPEAIESIISERDNYKYLSKRNHIKALLELTDEELRYFKSVQSYLNNKTSVDEIIKKYANKVFNIYEKNEELLTKEQVSLLYFDTSYEEWKEIWIGNFIQRRILSIEKIYDIISNRKNYLIIALANR